MLNMQLMLPVIDHNACFVRSDTIFNRSRDFRPQLRCSFDDFIGVFCWCGFTVEETAGGAVVDAELAFQAIARGFLAGEFEDKGVDV